MIVSEILYQENLFSRLPARTREGQRCLRAFAAGQDVDAVNSIIIVHLIWLAFKKRHSIVNMPVGSVQETHTSDFDALALSFLRVCMRREVSIYFFDGSKSSVPEQSPFKLNFLCGSGKNAPSAFLYLPAITSAASFEDKGEKPPFFLSRILNNGRPKKR